MADDLSQRYRHLLTGVYDCVDRIVRNAYFSMGQEGGGFRIRWRQLHNGSEDQLDNAHFMRMAGRESPWVSWRLGGLGAVVGEQVALNDATRFMESSSDVAGGEHAGHARLEGEGRTG